jgi:N6-adenosine-specific RNA methylase IME4
VRRFRCIAADPPWAPRDQLPGPRRGAARQYPVMPTPAIAAFPLPPLFDEAVLFLWRLASMQRDALEVATAWGFRVVSEVVWRKLTKSGLPWFGMGRTVRSAHETALVCLRGRAAALVRCRSIRSMFAAPVPTYGPGHPRIGQPLLDEDGEPMVDRKGRPRVIRVGDYIHSAKPEAFYTQIVEPLVRGPYVELFARRRRPRWHAIGNQVPELVERRRAA